jgi:hypothetical protein
MDIKTRRFSRMLAKFGFELVTIIAGILIALFVNNLQERNRDRRVLSSTFSALSVEFDENIENINKIQPKLERFRDTLRFYEKNTELSISDVTIKAPGLGTAELHTTNWQATLSSNSLRLLDFKTITLLSQIDAKHQELKEQRATLVAIIYSPALYQTGEKGYQYRKVVGDWLAGYMSNNQELMVLYNQFKQLIHELK